MITFRRVHNKVSRTAQNNGIYLQQTKCKRLTLQFLCTHHRDRLTIHQPIDTCFSNKRVKMASISILT